jgi:hypothetical protein
MRLACWSAKVEAAEDKTEAGSEDGYEEEDGEGLLCLLDEAGEGSPWDEDREVEDCREDLGDDSEPFNVAKQDKRGTGSITRQGQLKIMQYDNTSQTPLKAKAEGICPRSSLP